MKSLPLTNLRRLTSLFLASFTIALVLSACQEQNSTSTTVPAASPAGVSTTVSNLPTLPNTPTVTAGTMPTPANKSGVFVLKKTYPAMPVANSKDQPIVNLAFAPAGKNTGNFAVTTADCKTTLVALADGKKQTAFNGPSHSCSFSIDTEALAFSPDGKFLALAGDGFFDIRLVNLGDNTETRLANGLTATVSKIVFSPNGKYLAATSRISANAFATALWDVSTGKLVSKLKVGLLADLAFTPDSQFLATNSGKLIFWEVASGKELFSETNQEIFTQFTFSSDGKLLAGSRSSGALILDTATKSKLFSLGETTGKVEKPANNLGTYIPQLLSFAANNNHLLKLEVKQTLTVWEIAARKEVSSQQLPRPGLSALAISPDKKLLLAGYADGIVELWEILL